MVAACADLCFNISAFQDEKKRKLNERISRNKLANKPLAKQREAASSSQLQESLGDECFAYVVATSTTMGPQFRKRVAKNMRSHSV